MKAYYTDTFSFPLPEKHSFPSQKYALLRQRLTAHFASQLDLQVPAAASDEAILRAHSAAYFRRFVNGSLTDKEIRRVGLPWSRQIVKRTRYSVGGTIAACRTAIAQGAAVHLGGGTHHAGRDRGQGFCWLNDSVIAARAIQAAHLAEKILVVDCDVHQGNGTATIVKDDPSIFTFSIHGKNNFPYRKALSDMDIDLEDGTGNDAYLKSLEKGLSAATEKFEADLVIYLAGADPYREDRFGRLALTKAGLVQRDRMVFTHTERVGIPVAVTMAGGYAPDVGDIVDIHCNTVKALLERPYKKFSHPP